MKIIFIDIVYFSDTNSICADDFKEQKRTTKINVSCIESLSGIRTFKKPFSEIYVAKYSCLKMNSGNMFYIDVETYTEVYNKLKKFTLIAES